MGVSSEQARKASPEEVQAGRVGEEFRPRQVPGAGWGPYKGGGRGRPRSRRSLLSWGPLALR